MTHWKMPEIDRTNQVWVTPWGWRAVRPMYLNLGSYTDIGAGTVLLCHQGITIEENAQVGPNCTILSMDTESGKQGPVRICEDARVGANTVIMPNVTIGEHSIVGAGSVVTTNIPSNQVWVGTPARFMKMR